MTAHESVKFRRLLLVEFIDQSGASTWSECVAQETPHYWPETVETSMSILDQMIPLILDTVITHPNQVNTLLHCSGGHYPMAKASLEMGVWALWAQLKGESLASCLGGTRKKVTSGLSFGIQKDPEALYQKVIEAPKSHRIKCKIKPGYDLSYLKKLEQIKNRAMVVVDANESYSIEELPTLQAMSKLGVDVIEQPFKRDQWQDLAQAQKQSGLRICLDESIGSLEDVKTMIQHRAGTMLTLKPGRVGGLSSSLAIHHLCVQKKQSCCIGGMFETGIGKAYNVALASLPAVNQPGDLGPSDHHWNEDIVEPAWRLDKEGYMAVPFDKQGLGVTIDKARIAHYTIAKKEYKKS